MPLMAEAGIQLHLPTFKHSTLPELLDIGRRAADGGFGQVWVTDNLESRSTFVVLSALAVTVPIKLGTAVIVQYFHNPVGLASALASISELMDGRELSVGIARGNQYTPKEVALVKPITMLREAAQSLRRLWSGETAAFRDYPTLAAYFNLIPDTEFKLDVVPASPIRLYCGGNAPLSLAIGGEYMDGILYGPSFRAAMESGQIAGLLRIADDAAAKAGRPRPPRVGEIKISISRDREAARNFVRHSVGGRIISLRLRGYKDEDFMEMGILPRDVDRLFEARDRGVPRHELGPLVTDPMIDAFFIAGDPASCKDKVIQMCTQAKDLGFHQAIFSELGPNIGESIELLSREILPVML